jgi:hypothetical protein
MMLKIIHNFHALGSFGLLTLSLSSVIRAFASRSFVRIDDALSNGILVVTSGLECPRPVSVEEIRSHQSL